MKLSRTRWGSFLSLNWYDVALRFLFAFVAKTSEVLLAAGLIVSTANFLTDGNILSTYPTVSIAWAWAQALAIDSSLGVSFSYTFHCFKQEEWLRGTLYGLLTALLAWVAGTITTIDIVSHALHLSMNDAMGQMGINVTLLSRLRAVAVIGFILMSRLRDLPAMAPLMKAETESSKPLAPASGASQGSAIQVAIQSLCAQFSAEEMAQILNACVAAKKLVLTQVAPKEILKPQQRGMELPDQSHPQEHGPGPLPDSATQAEPAMSAEPPMEPPPTPVSSVVPLSKAPEAREPQRTMALRLGHIPGATNQEVPVAEPITRVPLEDVGAAVREPQRGTVAASEPDDMSASQRLEHAYQSLVAEGKKPSGRALAERAHVHRSTCVTWLRARRRQASEQVAFPQPEPENHFRSDEPVDRAPMLLPEKTLESDTGAQLADPLDRAMLELLAMKTEQDETVNDASQKVFHNSLLPGDTSDVQNQRHPSATKLEAE